MILPPISNDRVPLIWKAFCERVVDIEIFDVKKKTKQLFRLYIVLLRLQTNK